MTNAKSTRISPREVARILFRHWRKMALIFCGVLVLTVLTVALYPRSYSSEAKLVIRVGRESVALDPTATTGQTMPLQTTQDVEVNLAIDILSSHEVLQRVVETVGARRILDKLPSGDTASSGSSQSTSPASTAPANEISWISSLLRGLRLSEPGSDSDLAIRRLSSALRVWAPKQSTIITIGYSASSPELAHDVVQAVTNAFLEEHLQLNQTDGSVGFFAEQADQLHQELVAKQAELRDRKTAFQLTSGNSHPSMLEKSNEALREKIYELATQESDLKSRYTDEYPPLKELRRQKSAAEAALMAIPQRASNVADAAAGTDGKLYSELQTLNDQELQLAQLDRDVQLLDGKYRMHVEKLEQARVNEAMGRERITNIKIAQPATFVAKATWPDKRLLLAMGLIVAVCGAFGSALFAEGMDQTFSTCEQVEAHLGLPVLLSLPYRKRRKQRKATNTTNGVAAAKPAIDGHATNGHQSVGSYGPLLRELLTTNANGNGNGHRHAKSVGVVGCDASNLRSRVATELALRASRSAGEPVLLIDADSRHRRVAKRFNLNGSPGWREVLAGTVDAESCVHRPQSDNLAVMTAGGTNGNSPAAKSTNSLQQQLADIKTDYSLIVVDLPPARELEAPSVAAGWLDEMVLVVDAEHTRMQTAQHAKEMLERAGVRLTGVVLANRREHVPHWLYQRL
jgi:polysaccharide biosynthesis transport protein